MLKPSRKTRTPKGLYITNKCPTAFADGRTGRFLMSPSRDCIFLQCSADLYGRSGVCPNEIFLLPKRGFTTGTVKTETARKLFFERGWSIGPTMCPECIAKYSGMAEAPTKDAEEEDK